MAGAVAFAWRVFVRLEAPSGSFSVRVSLPQLMTALFFLGGLLLFHEFLHALPALLAGESDKVVIGIWPRYLAPYFAYLGSLPRRIQLLCGITPLLGLTVLPFAVALAFPSLSRWMATVSVLNVLGSAADLVMLGLIVRQVPAEALTRNQGHSTWWRL